MSNQDLKWTTQVLGPMEPTNTNSKIETTSRPTKRIVSLIMLGTKTLRLISEISIVLILALMITARDQAPQFLHTLVILILETLVLRGLMLAKWLLMLRANMINMPIQMSNSPSGQRTMNLSTRINILLCLPMTLWEFNKCMMK